MIDLAKTKAEEGLVWRELVKTEEEMLIWNLMTPESAAIELLKFNSAKLVCLTLSIVIFFCVYKGIRIYETIIISGRLF